MSDAGANPNLMTTARCVMLYHPLDTPPVALIRTLRDLHVELVSSVSPFDALARLLLFARALPVHDEVGMTADEEPTTTEGVRRDAAADRKLILLLIRPRTIAHRSELIAAVERYAPTARIWRYDEALTPHLAPFDTASEAPLPPTSTA